MGLKNEFWAAARATSGYEFWQQIKVMKTVDDGKPTDWLLAIPLQQWARHAFNDDAKCDDITNNMTESFNSWVGKLKGMPIIRIVDCIRQKCMVRLHKRFAKSCTWEGNLTPMAKQKLRQLIKESRNCSLFPGNNDEFEVQDGKPRYAVKLRDKIYSCQFWPVAGMPFFELLPLCCLLLTLGIFGI